MHLSNPKFVSHDSDFFFSETMSVIFVIWKSGFPVLLYETSAFVYPQNNLESAAYYLLL